MNASARLAHQITWAGSKQTYLTALLLVDRQLVDDCLRGYAYFRWVDDVTDISIQSAPQHDDFIGRQKYLVETLFRADQPAGMNLQEQMLADLVRHDRGPDGELRSFIDNFIRVMEFDAGRRGRQVTRMEMNRYTNWLATAVMDGIQYFIGNGCPHPKDPDRTQAVVAAHLVHMLRDMQEDLPLGYVNIPSEDLRELGIRMDSLAEDEAFRIWVQAQVDKARVCFRVGRRYINSLENLRCKLAGTWYCARFEWYLDAIQRDGFRLRSAYPGRQGFLVWMKMARLGLELTLHHFANRIRQVLARFDPRLLIRSERDIPSWHVK